MTVVPLNAAMPTGFVASTPRRWRRVLLAISFILLLALLAVFLAAPTMACWVAQGYLPWRATFAQGQVSVVTVGTAPASGASPELQVVATAVRVRAAASAAFSFWLPPGLLRTGQHGEGALSLPVLRERPFSWQLLVGGVAPAPLACVRIQPADLNRFLFERAQSTVEMGEQTLMSCTYVVDAGRVTGDDRPGQPANERRSLVTARGSIILDAVGFHRTLRVRSLLGHALTVFSAVPGGWHATCTVTIRPEDADAEPLSIPLVGDLRPLLIKQLEVAANRGMARGLDQVVLPPWFPTDMQLEVEIAPGQ